MRPINPFLFGRIEYERQPTLYMPDTLVDWASPRPQLFEGPRGSGKSSVLKALTWDVAWKVSPIRIEGSDAVKRFYRHPVHIGVYYRIQDMDVAYWDAFSDHTTRAQLFGTYLELVYVDLLLNALDMIRKKTNKYFTDRAAEGAFVASMLPECYPRKALRPHLPDDSFTALRSAVSETHLGLREAVYTKVPSEMVAAAYPIIGPGALSGAFAKSFVEAFPKCSKWTLILLLDDCDQLRVWQKQVVNTAIARAQGPLTYKIASVQGMYATTETLNEARSLVEHDLATVTLPVDQKSFYRLADEICRLRLREHCGRKYADGFELRKWLGLCHLVLCR